jgi:four helix bundle protein
MKFQEWLESVPKEITDDALWRMEVYRISLFAGELAWHDVTKLMHDRRTLKLSDQLFAAVGSVSANIAEGYSRSSHKDQARFYEYSLGSARESRNWYFEGRYVLGEKVAGHRIQLLTQIIRQLLNIIPAERGCVLREDSSPYFVESGLAPLGSLLERVPMSELMLDATRNT